MNSKKLFRPLIDAIIKGLQEIFVENRKADKVVAGILKSNSKWGSRDRAFIAENTYDIVRNWRLFKFLVSIENPSNTDDFEKIVTGTLLFKGYEPDLKILPFSKMFNKELIDNKLIEAEKQRVLKFSLPDWLDKLGVKELGEAKWQQEIEALHKTAELFVRINTLKTSADNLAKIFAQKQIPFEKVAGMPNALQITKRINVLATEEFRKGFFEVQDAGSQLIAEFLDIKPGMRVIDACAGAGGKSLQIATILQNKGKVIALDIEEFKLLELKKRAARNGIDTIETKLIEGKTLIRLNNSADRLLLDVPCSGLGVLKRNPDSKWKLSLEFIEDIQKTQAKILSDYSKMLKVGGQMVYATCSILNSENEEQVSKFLQNNSGFRLIQEKRVWPSELGFDGFYMAIIEKTA